MAPFKVYYTAMMTAMNKKGLESFRITVDEPDTMKLEVTYCAWAEIAKMMGDGEYCHYSTCYGDEVFFPHLCDQAGFVFEREGTIAQGAPVCDLRFTRKMN